MAHIMDLQWRPDPDEKDGQVADLNLRCGCFRCVSSVSIVQIHVSNETGRYYVDAAGVSCNKIGDHSTDRLQAISSFLLSYDI